MKPRDACDGTPVSACDRATMHYRPACLPDLAAVTALGAVVVELHHRAMPAVFASLSGEENARYWAQSLQDPNAVILVAEDDRGIWGFITATVVEEKHPLLQHVRIGRLGSICVSEARRRQGIGTGLLKAAEAWCKAKGAVDVRLNVWTFNEGALALYEKLGYARRSLLLGKPLA